jgi:Mrp family chromosome partitioning ATPase
MRPPHPPAEAASIVLAAPDETPLLSVPGEVLEALRYLVARAMRRDTLPARLSLLASARREGVTYLSRALALALVNDLRVRVCAVELNWHWPSPLPAAAGPGLAGVLVGQATLVQATLPTTNPGLSILPAGELSPADRGFYARSERLKELMAELEQQYDLLILDIPAVEATSDAIPLASLGLAGCLVVSQGKTTVEAARLALDDVDHLPMLGVLMNRARQHTPAAVLRLIAEG